MDIGQGKTSEGKGIPKREKNSQEGSLTFDVVKETTLKDGQSKVSTRKDSNPSFS
jgi:hypothetical protein